MSAWESHSEPECVRVSQRESQSEPERANCSGALENVHHNKSKSWGTFVAKIWFFLLRKCGLCAVSRKKWKICMASRPRSLSRPGCWSSWLCELSWVPGFSLESSTNLYHCKHAGMPLDIWYMLGGVIFLLNIDISQSGSNEAFNCKHFLTNILLVTRNYSNTKIGNTLSNIIYQATK